MTTRRNVLAEARKELLKGIGVPKDEPFKPDAFQLEAIDSLNNSQDTLVIAPTGAGKTYIAAEAIKHAISHGKRAIYTAPLKALSNTKYADFKRSLEPEYKVGLLTGDRKIDTDAHLVVATTEIYRNDLYSYGDHYSLVVLDEFHYLADPQRGPVWEESIILSPPSATLLMLSASISNPYEIADWIGETRNKKVHVIVEETRPVELRFGFIHPSFGLIPLEDEKGKAYPEIAHQPLDPRKRGNRRGGKPNSSRSGSRRQKSRGKKKK